MPGVRVREVRGDVLDQPVEALVNAWNRNFVPRRLLLTGGISGQLKKVTGPGPWRDLARMGVLQVGDAVSTSAGDMTGPKYLIHVAGLNIFWRASAAGVEACARSAVEKARELGVTSMAMPLIGAGHGGLSPDISRAAIYRGLESAAAAPAGGDLDVVLCAPSGSLDRCPPSGTPRSLARLAASPGSA
jgi:O-acetyl-ADP-ribose deacetylase (regulator of RNase III)